MTYEHVQLISENGKDPTPRGRRGLVLAFFVMCAGAAAAALAAFGSVVPGASKAMQDRTLLDVAPVAPGVCACEGGTCASDADFCCAHNNDQSCFTFPESQVCFAGTHLCSRATTTTTTKAAPICKWTAGNSKVLGKEFFVNDVSLSGSVLAGFSFSSGRQWPCRIVGGQYSQLKSEGECFRVLANGSALCCSYEKGAKRSFLWHPDGTTYDGYADLTAIPNQELMQPNAMSPNGRYMAFKWMGREPSRAFWYDTQNRMGGELKLLENPGSGQGMSPVIHGIDDEGHVLVVQAGVGSFVVKGDASACHQGLFENIAIFNGMEPLVANPSGHVGGRAPGENRATIGIVVSPDVKHAGKLSSHYGGHKVYLDSKICGDYPFSMCQILHVRSVNNHGISTGHGLISGMDVAFPSVWDAQGNRLPLQQFISDIGFATADTEYIFIDDDNVVTVSAKKNWGDSERNLISFQITSDC